MGPALEARALRAWFGDTRVLEGVDVALRRGEVHAILGVNGAGKTTFVRVLAGAHASWDGELLLEGSRVRFADPIAARRAGIATIHQELSLVGALTVAENLGLGARGAWIEPAREAREAQRVLDGMELDVDPRARVETLGAATQQLVEIARALADQAKVIVFDEATSALDDAEVRALFTKIRALKATGAAIAFVSHRAGEVEEIADRVTVLEGGKVALSAARSDVTRAQIARAMLRGDVTTIEDSSRGEIKSATERLSVRNLSVARHGDATKLDVRGVSFDVAAGSVVGMAGLRGSGASELLAAICGARPARSGAIAIDGEEMTAPDTERALARGVVYVPADRQREGVAPDLLAKHSATLSAHARRMLPYLLDERRERAAIEPLLPDMALRRETLDLPMRALSGGTQQKIALLRCLLASPKVLVMDEPTRGVDVGAKALIHRRLRALADDGAAVLFFSSEIEELLALADRVLVLARGAIALDAPVKEVSRERVVSAAIGEGRAA